MKNKNSSNSATTARGLRRGLFTVGSDRRGDAAEARRGGRERRPAELQPRAQSGVDGVWRGLLWGTNTLKEIGRSRVVVVSRPARVSELNRVVVQKVACGTRLTACLTLRATSSPSATSSGQPQRRLHRHQRGEDPPLGVPP